VPDAVEDGGSGSADRGRHLDEKEFTAEVHDNHDVATGVLASSMAERAPGYITLGFPDPRRLVW
jgi:hypothetical protein